MVAQANAWWIFAFDPYGLSAEFGVGNFLSRAPRPLSPGVRAGLASISSAVQPVVAGSTI